MFQTQYTRNNNLSKKWFWIWKNHNSVQIHTHFRRHLLLPHTCQKWPLHHRSQTWWSLIRGLFFFLWWHTGTQYRTKTCNKECPYLQRSSIIAGNKIFKEHYKKTNIYSNDRSKLSTTWKCLWILYYGTPNLSKDFTEPETTFFTRACARV